MSSPIHETGKGALRDAARQVAGHARRLAQLEVELAKAELKRKAGALGLGIALGGLAVLLTLFAIGFAAATVAAALATFLSTWLALLIVAAGLAVLAALCAAVAIASFKRTGSPVPEHALVEARLTTEALKR